MVCVWVGIVNLARAVNFNPRDERVLLPPTDRFRASGRREIAQIDLNDKIDYNDRKLHSFYLHEPKKTHAPLSVLLATSIHTSSKKDPVSF